MPLVTVALLWPGAIVDAKDRGVSGRDEIRSPKEVIRVLIPAACPTELVDCDLSGELALNLWQ